MIKKEVINNELIYLRLVITCIQIKYLSISTFYKFTIYFTF